MEFKGIILSLFCSIFFTLALVIVKYVDDVDATQKAFVRYVGILLFTIPLLINSGQNPFVARKDLQSTSDSTSSEDKDLIIPIGKDEQLSSELSLMKTRFLIIARSFCSSIALYLQYCSLDYLPLGDATVLALTVSIFVCVLARIFLKEPFGIFHVVTLILSLVGIALVSKMTFIFGGSELDESNEDYLFGILYGLSSAMLFSVSVIIVRRLKSLPPSVMLFNLSWISVLQFALITHFLTKSGFVFADCGFQSYLFMGIGIFCFLEQLFFTKSLQCEEAGLVCLLQTTSQVLFGFIFQITIFNDTPDWWSIGGAILVVISVALIPARKYLQDSGLIEGEKKSWVQKALRLLTL